VEHARQVLTIGHSTHPAEHFLALLRAHGIELLCDVRRFPGSRRHPQYNAGALEAALDEAGIAYERLGAALGGRRRTRRDPSDTGWRAASFQAYAAHMQTPEFAAGLGELEALARERRTAMMCAEGDWRRCHRRLISEALATRGWQVIHIRPDGRTEPHELTIETGSGLR
jgi:uncharacterized protein (DUF488 family)